MKKKASTIAAISSGHAQPLRRGGLRKSEGQRKDTRRVHERADPVELEVDRAGRIRRIFGREVRKHPEGGSRLQRVGCHEPKERGPGTGS